MPGRIVAPLAVIALACFAASASAGVPRHIIFPVVGHVTYIDDFGVIHDGIPHQGNDLMGARRMLVVAAERGHVQKWTSSSMAGCMLYLYGRSGTTYEYIHLNNDRTRGNDNAGGCRNGIAYAPGLRSGQRVRAGQLVGYMGDSGDANGIQPHLHFEVHPNGGSAISPYRTLRRGRHLIFAAPWYVHRVWMRLKGRLMWTSPRIAIRVRRVHASTGRNIRVSKAIGFAAGRGLVVERRTQSGVVKPIRLAALQPGDRVTVWTTGVAPTLARRLALPGAWTAKHVVQTP